MTNDVISKVKEIVLPLIEAKDCYLDDIVYEIWIWILALKLPRLSVLS